MLQLPLRPLLPSLSRSFQPLLSALVFLELLVFHVPEVVIAQYGNIYHYDHLLILLVHHCYVQLVSHHQKCLQVPQDLGSVHCPSRLSDNREGIGCSDFVLFIQLIPEDLSYSLQVLYLVSASFQPLGGSHLAVGFTGTSISAMLPFSSVIPSALTTFPLCVAI